jgi:hypothetical protein
MPRFNFDLVGGREVRDPGGMIFADSRAAAQFAEKLAAEIGAAHPDLIDTTSVVMTDDRRSKLTYCVAVGSRRHITALDA